MICRLCGGEREIQVRKPFAKQTCEACLRDKKARIDRAIAYNNQRQAAKNSQEAARWQALSEVARQKEIAKYDCLWRPE